MSGSTFLFYLNSDELCDELLKSISETFFCPLHYTSPPHFHCIPLVCIASSVFQLGSPGPLT